MKLFSPLTAAFLLCSIYLASCSKIDESISRTQILAIPNEKKVFIEFLESNGIPFDTFKNTGRVSQIAHDFNGPYAIHFQKLINFYHDDVNKNSITSWSSFATLPRHTRFTTPWTDVHNTHQEYIRVLKEEHPDSFLKYKTDGTLPSIEEYKDFMVSFQCIQNVHDELGEDWDEFASKLPTLLKEDLYATDEKFEKYLHPLIEELNVDELVWARSIWNFYKNPIKVMQNYFYPLAKTYAIELFEEKAGVVMVDLDFPKPQLFMYEWDCFDQSDSYQEYKECLQVFNIFISPMFTPDPPNRPRYKTIKIMDFDKFDVLKKATLLFPSSFSEKKLDNWRGHRKLFKDLKDRFDRTLFKASKRLFDEKITIEQIESMDYEKKH